MTDVVGLRFVAEGEREATNAMKRFQSAQDRLTRSVLDGASRVQSVSSAWNRANQAFRDGVLSANALRAAQTQVARELAVLNNYTKSNGDLNTQRALAELRAAQAARENAEATKRQAEAAQRAQQGYQRLRASIDPVFAAQQRMKQAHDTVREALARETITRKQAADTLRLYRQRLRETGQSTVVATDLTSRLRTQFLATANTIAILDGPLGGIASRFSAFGVLIGRTGLLLAGAAIAMTTFIAIAGRGVRQFAEFEVQMAKMNAVLETTGHASGLTGQQIERMSAQIALATLETETGVRQAAMRLLSFRDISGQVFEDVLKAAADMAALGFGTVESEAVKLAKALEDPAQALTSLSRAGIIFTRQQRAMIISMVESGDRLGAMERILENVNKRVGGAAEAAARNTFAGDLDTIAQATGRAVRTLGEFIVNVAGVGWVVRGIARDLADFAVPASQIQQLQDAVTSAEEALQRMLDKQRLVAQQPFVGPLTGTDEGAQIAAREARDLAERIAAQRQLIALERARLTQFEAIARLQQQTGQVERRREGIDNLRAEIELREQLIGLTEQEQRARRAFAAEGLLNVDVNRTITEYRNALAAAGVDWGIIQRLTLAHRRELEGLQADLERYLESLERQRAASAAQSRSTQLRDENDLLAEQIQLLSVGSTIEEARELAALRIEENLIQRQLANANLNQSERDTLQSVLDQLRVGQMLLAVYRDLADAAQRRAEIEGRTDTLDEENELLLEQIRLLDQGIEFTEALRQAEINLELARAATLVTTGAITQQMYAQLEAALLLNQALRQEVETRRPARGGGAAREVEDLAAITAEMDKRIDRQMELVRVFGQEQRALELVFEIQDRLEKAGLSYTEQEIRGVAARIAAREEELNQMEEMRRQQERLAEVIESSMERAFMSIVDGTKSAKDAFKEMARQIIAELFRVLVVQQLVGQLKDGPLGGLFRIGTTPRVAANGAIMAGGSMLPFANGAVLANMNRAPNVVPFATGGVVGSPTMFPMRGGQTGLMGEAGPEAIMPLKRGKDGKLGVQAEGAGVINITQHFNVSANGDDSVKRIVAQQVPAIAEATKAAVIDARKRGGQMRAAFR